MAALRKLTVGRVSGSLGTHIILPILLHELGMKV
jgi:hypothetical protein